MAVTRYEVMRGLPLTRIPEPEPVTVAECTSPVTTTITGSGEKHTVGQCDCHIGTHCDIALS